MCGLLIVADEVKWVGEDGVDQLQECALIIRNQRVVSSRRVQTLLLSNIPLNTILYDRDEVLVRRLSIRIILLLRGGRSSLLQSAYLLRVMLAINFLDLVEIVANTEGDDHELVVSPRVHPCHHVEEAQLDDQSDLEHVREVQHVHIAVSCRQLEALRLPLRICLIKSHVVLIKVTRHPLLEGS